ncbi:hypothetical protein WJX77_009296 [Trebouxia sp. C0004]
MQKHYKRPRRPGALGKVISWFTVAVCLLLVLYVGTVRLPSSSSSPKYYRRRLDGSSKHAKLCDENFGEAWLAQWNDSAKALCQPGSASGSTQLTCRSMDDQHMTQASQPHVLCDAVNLKVDPSHMLAASCLKHRPNYLCNFGTTYNRYLPGAFGMACTSAIKSLKQFPKDHLQDIMDSMARISPETAAQVQSREALPSLLVTREVTEHVNVFHTLTDLLNVYISLRMLGLENQSRQVIMMDRHMAGPLDGLWPAVAAGAGFAALDTSLERLSSGGAGTVRQLHTLNKTMLQQAIFVPPGYTSLLYAHGHEDNSCPYNTALFKGFREWFLGTLSLPSQGPSRAGQPVRVVLISRKPYGKKKRVARQIHNEQELFAMVEQVQGVQARLIDLAHISLAEQIQLVSSGTDILIGMHGAALAWSLMMPPGTALLELWPQPNMWRLYEHTAQWAGLHYRHWASQDKMPHSVLEPPTSVDVQAIAALLKALVAAVHKA